MRYNLIRKMDISNGPGIRVSLFTQGCFFHCKNCFNTITWDPNGGKQFGENEIKTILKLCESENISGLSILGGEPLLERNYEALLNLVLEFKQKYPKKDIWLWTGNLFETLVKSENKTLKKLLEYIDIIVDGQFMEEQKDITLKYRGSTNQRVICVKKSLRKKKVILYKEV